MASSRPSPTSSRRGASVSEDEPKEEIVVRLADSKVLTFSQRIMVALGYGLAAAIVTVSLGFVLASITGRSSLERAGRPQRLPRKRQCGGG